MSEIVERCRILKKTAKRVKKETDVKEKLEKDKNLQFQKNLFTVIRSDSGSYHFYRREKKGAQKWQQ